MITTWLVALFVGLAVFCLFLALRRFSPKHDPTEDRLREFGLTEYVKKGNAKAKDEQRQHFNGMDRLLHGFGAGEKLGLLLMRADVPLTTSEFAFLMAGIGGAGLVLGAWRLNFIAGLVLGGVLGLAPVVYLKIRTNRRRDAFTNQLPDLLTLLVGSLRAGYGLSQAMELVAREVPAPACIEFQRVMRALSLGLPLHRGLEGMAERIQSDDLDLVVTAINVQTEMGGNLSSVLENISDTIRQRVKVLREVRALTAQQRMTGFVLALLPIGLGIAIGLMQPGYFEPFLEPGWPRMLPIAALIMMGIGFFLIQKIVNIKV